MRSAPTLLDAVDEDVLELVCRWVAIGVARPDSDIASGGSAAGSCGRPHQHTVDEEPERVPLRGNLQRVPLVRGKGPAVDLCREQLLAWGLP
jgi:hypothetical protein